MVYSVLAALFRFFKALPALFIGVHEAVNAFEFLRRRFKFFFCVGVLHVNYGASINSRQAVIFITLIYMIAITLEFIDKLLIAETNDLFEIAAVIKRFSAIFEVFLPANTALGHKLAEVCLRIFGIDIKHLFAVFIRFFPLSVLKEHKCALQKRLDRAAAAVHNNGLFDRSLRFIYRGYFSDAAYKILHEAELGHILCQQMRKFLRQVIGIHVSVCRNEHLFAAGFLDERKIATPFVFDPYGVEMLGLCSDNDHDLRRVERREYVRLVRCAELVLQRYSAEKHLEAFLSELMVKVVCQHRIRRSSAAVVGLLIADENIKRLFLLRNFKNALLDLVDRLCFFFVNAPLISIGILQSGFIVIIVKNRCVLCAVYRRHTLVGSRVFDVFDTIAAKHQRPVCFSIGAVLIEYLLVDAHCFIKIIVSAEMIRAVVQICLSIVVKARKRLLRTAGVAHSNSCSLLKFNLAAAHFAFKC